MPATMALTVCLEVVVAACTLVLASSVPLAPPHLLLTTLNLTLHDVAKGYDRKSVLNRDSVTSGESESDEPKTYSDVTDTGDIFPLCPRCGARALVEALGTHTSPPDTSEDPVDTSSQPPLALTDEAIREIRIEMIKTQILSKMQMKEKPHVQRSREEIPRVISGGGVLPLLMPPPPTTPPTNPASTRTSIFLATNKVSGSGRRRTACFLFTMDGKSSSSVEKATLWLWKVEDPADGSYQTLTIKEVAPNTRHKTLLSHKTTSVREGWVEVDLSDEVERWVASGKEEVEVEVTCRTCQGRHHPVSRLPDHRPFIVVVTEQPQVRKRRSSRECPSLWGGGCCRQAINVSVAEMGWENWLLHPQSFTFYYCHGACRVSVASANAPGISRYSNILQMLLLRQAPRSTLREALAPCCSPTSYSSMQVLFRSGSERVEHMQIPDFLVQSCGCNG
ncbi:inhibin beta B chain [Procambarus clarkii]|uniref:inhibin beta B chain n=1 Tax=Procambarus clarkii TaxID=6728 RepID=UPI0037420F32